MGTGAISAKFVFASWEEAYNTTIFMIYKWKDYEKRLIKNLDSEEPKKEFKKWRKNGVK